MEHWIRARFQPNLPLGKNGRRLTACRQHIEISRQAAREGMVLLKNNSILPLEPGQRVAFFGKGTIDYVPGGGGSGEVYPPFTHNIVDGFRRIGKNPVFEESVKFYENYVRSQYESGFIPGLIKECEVPEELLIRARAFTDTAILSFSRYSGEGWDRKSDFGGPAEEPEDGFTHIHLAERIFEHSDFYLTEAEQSLVKAVKTHFHRIVVLLNVGGMVDTRWIREDEGISAALLTWQGGMCGGDAAAELLCGLETPSGHLSDTFAGTLEDYPSTAGFHESDDYVQYTEDIYVGYRYFETIPGAAEKVVYPFGYGLSYTAFQISGLKASIAQIPTGEKDPEAEAYTDEIRFSLLLTNTGAYKGREVLQLYAEAPQGKLGKPRRSLVSYLKSRELQPGESEWMELRVPEERLASYDDEGLVRKSAWVLEQGEYHFYLGNDVRSAQMVDFCYTVPEDRVIRQLSSKLAPSALEARLRSDGSLVSVPRREGKNPDLNIFEPLDPEATECLAPSVRAEDGYCTFKKNKPTLSDAAEGRLSLDELVSELNDEELAWLLGGTPNTGCANTFGFGGIHRYEIPSVMTCDGPAGVRIEKITGVRTTAFPCATLLSCTWDPKIAELVGRAGGEEARENNLAVWLTPAVNIHRSPLCGRNFEYYSEDPLLTACQASGMVRGIQSTGTAACVKHFAFNNKETNRKDSDSQVSERAAREIYLRQFEWILRFADPWALMTSYNRVNGWRTSECRELLTGILRREWNYQGLVTTDWWNHAEQYKECHAGNDVKMGCGFPERLLEALRQGAVSRAEMELAAKHILTLILKVDDAGSVCTQDAGRK